MGVRKARAAETVAALKEAAREQFLARGYGNTKITDITAAAGRSTGSFYEHFASKQDLLDALLADMRGAASEVMSAPEHPREHDLTDRAQLRAHLAAAWQVMRANLPVMLALQESSLAEPGLAWRQMVGDTSVLREHLEWLVEQGRSLPGDPTLTAAAIGGMLSSLAYAVLRTDTAGLSDEQVLDTITELVLSGLRGGS
jgi:AcrR family transcriptional regulator